MRNDLYETIKINPYIDETNKLINETIDYYLKDDVFYEIYPILAKGEIDYKNNYFTHERITPSTLLTSKEYKTLSYLAPFYKEKIKYNPLMDIQRYLKFLGYDFLEDDFNLLCLEMGKPYDDNLDNYIYFKDYLQGKEDGTLTKEYVITNKIYIKKHRSVIESNLSNSISERFILLFDSTNSALFSIVTKVSNSSYADGFDVLFDRTPFR